MRYFILIMTLVLSLVVVHETTAQTQVHAWQVGGFNTGDWLIIKGGSNLDGVIEFIDDYLTTNALVSTSYVMTVVNTASNNLTNWFWTAYTSSAANVATTNWVTQNFYRASNPSGFVSGVTATSATSQAAGWAFYYHDYTVSGIKDTIVSSNGVIISNLIDGSVGNNYASLLNDTTIKINSQGVYQVRADMHVDGGDTTFRDWNKEGFLFLNGTNMGSFGKADGKDSVWNGTVILPLNSNDHLNLLIYSSWAGTVTSIYDRIDLFPIGGR